MVTKRCNAWVKNLEKWSVGMNEIDEILQGLHTEANLGNIVDKS
jgi:hypothetical protein